MTSLQPSDETTPNDTPNQVEDSSASEAPTRLPSNPFKLFFAGLLALLIIVAAILFGGAYRNHHGEIDVLGQNQKTYLLSHKTSTGSITVAFAQSVAGSQKDGKQNIITSFPTLTTKSFILKVKSSDGYAWQYNSQTKVVSSGCSSLTCFFGIQIG